MDVGQRMLAAIESDDLDAVRQLVEGAPSLVSAPLTTEDRPLHYAAWQKRPAIVRYLLDKGSDATRPGHQGMTPLHYAAQGGGAVSLDIARMLVGAGADVDAVDDLGQTPLDYAVGEADPELEPLIEFLLASGARMTVSSGLFRLGEREFIELFEREKAQTPDNVLHALEILATGDRLRFAGQLRAGRQELVARAKATQ